VNGVNWSRTLGFDVITPVRRAVVGPALPFPAIVVTSS
jgi:hypothetical protein